MNQGKHPEKKVPGGGGDFYDSFLALKHMKGKELTWKMRHISDHQTQTCHVK